MALFNGRPGIVEGVAKSGLIATPYGLLDPNPSAGEALLGRNAGRGPRLIAMNLRLAKTTGFGGERKGSGGGDQPQRQGAGGGGGGPGGGLVPAAVMVIGLGNLIGRPSTSRRYNPSLSMSVRNLLNPTLFT
ncbi:hypothetical protein SBA6_990002 [Candidatus Sulfopaludibacter sp. SbA6]|nr:hypothetical protein SBA6_990002 [Candidatus Sulfopaludibacter sp. SbA6]